MHLETYQGLPLTHRTLLHEKLSERIDRHNEAIDKATSG